MKDLTSVVSDDLAVLNDICIKPPFLNMLEELKIEESVKSPLLEYRWCAGSVDYEEKSILISNLKKAKKDGWRPLSALANPLIMTPFKAYYSKGGDYIRLPGYILLGKLKLKVINGLPIGLFADEKNISLLA